MANTELIEAGFTYADIEPEAAAKLRWCANEINRLKEKLAGNALAIGERLTTAQEQLANHSGGKFLEFVEFECGYSKSSAYNYIAAFKVFGSLPTVGKLEDGAMYALAQNGTPEKALKEVLKLADNGARITQKQAKAIIKKHKPPKGPSGGSGGATKKSKPAPEPPKPEPTKEELLKLEIKKVRSYAEYLQRGVDDLNHIKRNTVIHPQLIKLCGQILEGLERW